MHAPSVHPMGVESVTEIEASLSETTEGSKVSLRTRLALVTVVVGILAFLLSGGSPLGAAIWSPSLDIAPVGIQLPLLLFVTMMESLALGFGTAFLAFGWPTVKRLISRSNGWAAGSYASFAWLFVSPWFHDNLHMRFGHELDAVIALNYLFHFGMVPFVAILLYVFFRLSAGKLGAS